MLRNFAFLVIYALLVCAAIFGAYRDYLDSLVDWSMTGACILLFLGLIYELNGKHNLLKYLTLSGLLLSLLACAAMIYSELEERLVTVILFLFLSQAALSGAFTCVPNRPLEIPNIRKYPLIIFAVISLSGYAFMELRGHAGSQAWMLVLIILSFSMLVLTAFNRAYAVSKASYIWVFIGALALLGFDLCYVWIAFDDIDPLLSPLRYGLLGLGLWAVANGLSEQVNTIED
jgi:hypothetical protein